MAGYFDSFSDLPPDAVLSASSTVVLYTGFDERKCSGGHDVVVLHSSSSSSSPPFPTLSILSETDLER